MKGITQQPHLKEIYEPAAQRHDGDRRPVIVIPGILGSRLESDAGRTVWGAFDNKYANPSRPDGARLVAMPMDRELSLTSLQDDVQATQVLDRLELNILFVPVSTQTYAGVLATLGVGGYRDSSLASIDYGNEHFTCFQFPYDWRRDNAENAARLEKFIQDRRAYVHRERLDRFGIDEPDVRFDIVAHSMGGLLTRYFLRYGGAPLPEDGSVPPVTWAGTQYVDRVIVVGTPSSGSVWSMKSLIDGEKFAPILPRYPAAILGSMPSSYQLMPRGRDSTVKVVDGGSEHFVDPMDPEVWWKMKWGLADPRQDKVLRVLLPDVGSVEERRSIALDHLDKCLARARQFQAAVDQPVVPPPNLHLELFAGDAEPTPSLARFDTRKRKLSFVNERAGDGTVLRSSALADQRAPHEIAETLRTPVPWKRSTFISSDHIGLTSDPVFTDNVLFTLLEERRKTFSPAMPNVIPPLPEI